MIVYVGIGDRYVDIFFRRSEGTALLVVRSRLGQYSSSSLFLWRCKLQNHAVQLKASSWRKRRSKSYEYLAEGDCVRLPKEKDDSRRDGTTPRDLV
jgi:hypothetical protein